VEYVVGFVGHRGGGKSVALCYLALVALASGRKVFANMPIGGDFAEGRYDASPLDTNELYSFGQSLQNSVTIIDEMQFTVDARESQTNKNKLMNWLTTQIRKKELSIAYSVQDFMWVDTRVRFQTDILVQCSDLFHTPWGRENHLRRGVEINLKFFDLSGVMTGVPARVSGRPYHEINLYAKPLWSMYNSFLLVGQNEAFNRYEIERTTISIGRGDNGHDGDPGSFEVDTTGVIPYVPERAIIDATIGQLKSEGHDVISAVAMRALLAQNGLTCPPNRIGKLLVEHGVVVMPNSTRGRSYALP